MAKEPKTVRMSLTLSLDEIAAVDEWRTEHAPPPLSRTQAIRMLLKKALKDDPDDAPKH
jgi:hypothetical protein